MQLSKTQRLYKIHSFTHLQFISTFDRYNKGALFNTKRIVIN